MEGPTGTDPAAFTINYGQAVICTIVVEGPIEVTTGQLMQAITRQHPVFGLLTSSETTPEVVLWVHEIHAYGVGENALGTTLCVNTNPLHHYFTGTNTPTGFGSPHGWTWQAIDYGIEGGANPHIHYRANHVNQTAVPFYIPNVIAQRTQSVCMASSHQISGTPVATLIKFHVSLKVNTILTNIVTFHAEDYVKAKGDSTQIEKFAEERVQRGAKVLAIKRIKELSMPILDSK